MKRSVVTIAGSFILSVFLLASCKFSTANVSEAFLCKGFDKDGMPLMKTASFDIGASSISCAVKAANIPSETKLRAVWYSIDPKSKERKEMIRSEFAVKEDRWVNFYITPPSAGFMAGEYAVDIFMDEKQSNSLSFSITGPKQNAVIESALIAGKDPASGKLQEQYVFTPSVDVVYAQVVVKDAPENTTVEAVWYQIAQDSDERGKIVETSHTMSGSDMIDFTFTPSAPMPVSRYCVDILVNKTLSNTLYFVVK